MEKINRKANTDRLNQYFTDAFYNEETQKFNVKCKVKSNDQCCGKILVRNRDSKFNKAFTGIKFLIKCPNLNFRKN